MARLDRVKNLSGLAEWFAGNQRLRKLVNLVIVGTYPNLCQQDMHQLCRLAGRGKLQCLNGLQYCST